MIIIGDGGSTKIDWQILDVNGESKSVKTMGFNPFLQKGDELANVIQAEVLPNLNGRKVESVFYYGSGCSSDVNCNIVYNAIISAFPESKIEVNHDLLGAARALCERMPGIACILGTGSNSCLFNGTEIVANIASLGYVLGDEGSGTHMGKMLLADFLRNEMPEDIHHKMKAMDLDKSTILAKVYQGEKPAKYISGFARFLYDNQQYEYIHRLIDKSISAFFTTNVCRYDNYKKYDVHFVGGIANSFGTIVKAIAKREGVRIGNIIENPIAGLSRYHQQT